MTLLNSGSFIIAVIRPLDTDYTDGHGKVRIFKRLFPCESVKSALSVCGLRQIQEILLYFLQKKDVK